jgi:hypothetical protein
MHVVRRMSVFAVYTAVAVGACGDSSGPGGPSSVALLVNTSFVQYDTSDYAAEASELEFTLKQFGIAVAPLIGYDSASLSAALMQNRVFIIPEQEFRALADSLTPAAQQALRHFVDSTGGVLILSNDFNGRAGALLDTLFGHTIADGFSDFNYSLGGGSVGTPFADGPALIWDNDGTYTLDPTSLPAGSRIIYQGPGGGVALATIPQGRGTIVILGWDFYNAEPHGSQDGGWIEAFRRALRS